MYLNNATNKGVILNKETVLNELIQWVDNHSNEIVMGMPLIYPARMKLIEIYAKADYVLKEKKLKSNWIDTYLLKRKQIEVTGKELKY